MEIVPIDNYISNDINDIISKDSMIPRCKICFEESNEILGELISPCNCSGSIKYVHIPCLNKWRFNNINRESKYNYVKQKYFN